MRLFGYEIFKLLNIRKGGFAILVCFSFKLALLF
jgi:hypothetical protein